MDSAGARLSLAMIMSLGAAGCGSGGSHADRATEVGEVGMPADASDVAHDEVAPSTAEDGAPDNAPETAPSDAEDRDGPLAESRDAAAESGGANAGCGSPADPRNCGICGMVS